MQIENVSLVEVIAAARGRHVSLVPESTGYLMLGVIRAMGGRPVHVDSRRVMLNTEGIVSLSGHKKRRGGEEVAAALHRMLGTLLDVSQGVGNALRAIAAAGPPPLETLFTGITKSLIPINRSAAKRALGRVARETVRARNRGLLSSEDIDAAARDSEASPAPALIRAPAKHEDEQPEPAAASVVETAPVIDEAPAAVRAATPAPAEPVTVAPEPEPEEWEDIDAEFELATPIPLNIELATPTPSPVAIAAEAAAAAASDDAPDEAPSHPGAERVETREAIHPPPAPEAPPAEPLVEAAACEPLDSVAPVSMRSEGAPFIRVTPAPSIVDESPSPLGVTSSTPTIVDATLYGLTGRLSTNILVGADDPGRISAMSVQLPPAEPVDAPDGDEDVELAISEEPPAVAPPEDAKRAVEATAADSEPPASDDEPNEACASEPQRKSDIEQEAELAERLLAAAEARREQIRPGTVEALLESFGSSEESDAVTEAAASLKRMMSLDLTPPPAMTAPEDPAMEQTPSNPPVYDNVSMDAVPSVSPPPVHVADADAHHLPRLTPTSMTLEPPHLAQRALFVGTTVLLAGVFILGFLYWQHPHTLGLERDSATATALGGAPAPAAGPCYADLTLKDLPSPHEVLLRLGQAPFTTRALPTGVTLELIGLAPGHQPKRVVLPADTSWSEGPDGAQMMALHVALDGGETNTWPDAPAGEVGGLGPKGSIDITAKPENTEVWLVAGAGEGDRSVVTVPCEATAHILVLNPRDPARRRRLSVEPNMLDAARHAGGAELSVTP